MLDGGVIHERGTCYLPAYMDRLDGGAHEDVLEGAAGLAVEAQLHRPVLDGDRLQAFAVGECGVSTNVTAAGMAMDVSASQPEKAFVPMVLRLSGSSTAASAEQL